MKYTFDPVTMIYIILIFSILGAFVYIIMQPKEIAVICTEEALICPDGSSTGRIGPDCQFESCPTLTKAEEARFNYYKGDLVAIYNLKTLEDQKPNLFSSDYILLTSIPLNFSSTEFIDTYLKCSSENCSDVGTETELIVTKYNSENQSSINIGKIHSISKSNSGGIFVPVYLTSDNQKIILDAWMGSPGAGGGDVDYGFAIINMPSQESEEIIPINDSNFIATNSAIFYNNYDNVVYLEESEKSPQFSKPGPINSGKVISRNLINNIEKIILEEPYSSYDIKTIDNNILSYEETHYSIPKNCEAVNSSNEWIGITLDCVLKTITIKNINL